MCTSHASTVTAELGLADQRMAVRERDRLGVGSTVSLQGGEHIPREYHRRILKKIAQLTKVIYNLNTKIDENEEFVSGLRSIHETENRRILDDSAAQLKQCEEGFVRERESAQKQLEKLRKALEDTRGERDLLYEKQVSYRKEVEDQLSALKSQHTTKVQSLVTELEKFQSEQEKQLKQVNDLRSRLSKKAAEDIKALKFTHEEEIGKVRLDCEQQIQLLKNDISVLKSEHVKEIDLMTKRFQSELEAQSKSLTSAQRDLLSQERQAWEEKEKQMTADFLEKEEQLKQQISSLSKELRASNDKLALAEQRIRDLEVRCDENQAGSGTLRAMLEKSEADIECLRGSVSNLQTDLDIAKEKYRQQTAELQAMSGTVAKLEALRISNEGVIRNLQSELAALQDKLRLLQEERDGLENSRLNITESQGARIKALEKELGKVRGEKQELHAQFAREIEAAHAQLSNRETELEQQHHRAVREMEEQHSKELVVAEEEKKSSLDNLKLELLSQREQELQQVHDSHASQLSQLKAELADRASQLELALQELKALRDRLLKEEKGLGSATSEIDRLRVDLTQCQTGLLSSQRECADVKTENAQLKTAVESLRRQTMEGDNAHCEELKRTRADLSAELETVWRERVKRETASVRTELTQRHSEEKRMALEELAGLKDTAFRLAGENWEREKRQLLDKIESMEDELRRLQQATSASLEEAKTSSDGQISSLRKELENEIQRHKEALASLQEAHLKQLQSLQAQSEQEKNALTAQLRDHHKQELLALQQANQLAVNTLREKLESDKREAMMLAEEEHHEEMKALEEKLGVKFDGDLARVNETHLADIERFRQQIENVVIQSQKQMQTQESIADGLRREIEGRDSELGVLRDKSNSLTVAIADLKKQLTVREQELQLARREAKSTLRIREQQLIATHHSELEAVNAQHRHKAQQLLTDFNKAKSLLNSKIHDLERQLSEWEHRYKMRESKPEDLEAIRELRMIVREQEQKMKDLVAEKRVYQLELMNREKNYNKLFNVNPQVGVLNPLQLKQRKPAEVSSDPHKYASAPSLLAPLSPEPPSFNPAPLPHSLKLATLSNDGGLTSSGTHLSKKAHLSQSSVETKPQKLVMLRDSPLVRKKGAQSESSRKSLSSHSGPLQPVETQSQSTVGPQKHTMIVQ